MGCLKRCSFRIFARVLVDDFTSLLDISKVSFSQVYEPKQILN